MIDREQLAEALGRLDPSDREILDYSLRRRVPDDDLGEILGGSPGDVARQRTAAVETLSNALGVQQGSDLGDMLKALLDPATWEMVPRPTGSPEPEAGHLPVGADPVPVAPIGQGGTGAASDTPAAVAPESPAGSEEVVDPAEVVEPDPEVDHAPVLGILNKPREQDEGSRGGGTGRRTAVGVAVAVALLVPAGVVAALSGTDPVSTGGVDSDSGTRPFAPEPDATGDAFPSDPDSAFQYPVAYVDRRTVLYDKPGGKVKVRIAAKTEWDSPRALGIVKREGSWLAVLAPELENGEVGWIREGGVKRLETVTWSLHADLSQRTLVVRRNGKDVRSMKVGVGRKDHPTPVGRYAVTDKLRVNEEGSPYGCCVLALTGHQTKLPAGWPGGDRLAVHATADTSGLGQAVSLGCMRADPKDAAWMLKTLPLGTPVFVRR